MQPAFFLLPMLYFAAMVVVVAIAVTALWRIMKAQEATARALQKIADRFETRS